MEVCPDASEGRVRNRVGQIWAFAKGISMGDWVVRPSKHKSAIHVGEVKGNYVFDPGAEDPYHH